VGPQPDTPIKTAIDEIMKPCLKIAGLPIAMLHPYAALFGANHVNLHIF
jgi:hypothetical protein